MCTRGADSVYVVHALCSENCGQTNTSIGCSMRCNQTSFDLRKEESHSSGCCVFVGDVLLLIILLSDYT